MKINFSFLLAAEHGLGHETRLLIQSYYDTHKKLIGSNVYIPFREFTSEVVVNPSPLLMKPRHCSSSTSDVTPSIHILKCSESVNQYELDVSLRGFTISSLNSKSC